jgi:hypothetical protein
VRGGARSAYNLLGASSAVAVVVGATRHRPAGRFAWYLIALGEVMFVLGDVLAYNHERLFGREAPFPSVADPLYLAMYPMIAAGLVLLGRLRGPTRDRAGLIDALIVAVGFGTLSWAYLMAPYAHDTTLTLAQRATSIAYPAMDLVLLGVAVRLLLGTVRRSASSQLLAAALLTLLVTDAVYAWLLLGPGYEPDGLLDGGWFVSYVLLGTAALHPSMRTLSERAPAAGVGLTGRRLALLAGTSIIAPGLQVVRALLDQPGEPLIAVASGSSCSSSPPHGAGAGAGPDGGRPAEAPIRVAARRPRPALLRRRGDPRARRPARVGAPPAQGRPPPRRPRRRGVAHLPADRRPDER